MEPQLPFTGERFTPECLREMWYEHWHRYALAETLVRDKTVLDIASGEGYGTHLLARCARYALGIDISPEAVAHAQRRYGGRNNLAYVVGDCSRIPLAAGSMDAVVSFETVEHIPHQEGFIQEIGRVLKPEGFLILSSPNRPVYSQGYENPYHIKELDREELEALLAPHFKAVKLLSQKLLFHSVIWDGEGERCRSQVEKEGSIEDGWPYPAMYFIALCARDERHLPGLQADVWCFGDIKESVYGHYNETVRRNIHQDKLLMERERIIAERDRQLAERDRRLAERDRHLAACQARLAYQESWRFWFRRPFRAIKRRLIRA